MKTDINKIFSKSSCLTNNEMLEYLSGKLSVSDKRRIEIHVADCEMCNDELEGLSNLPDPLKLPAIVQSLNSDIDTYLNQLNQDGTNKSTKNFNIRRFFAVAASLLLLISAGFIVNYYLNKGEATLADMNMNEVSELSEEPEFETAKKLEKEESLERDVNSPINSKEKQQSDRIISDQTGNNIGSSVASGEISKTSEISSDDDLTIIKEEEGPEESNVDLVTDVSEDRKSNANRNEVNVLTSDEELSETEVNDSFAGFATRNVSKESVRSKKDKVNKYKSIKSSALLSFDEKVYKEAADGFENYLVYKPNDSEIIYKFALSSFYIKDYSNALKYFNKILSNADNKYYDDAEWYKSQTLMKTGRNEEAADLLRKIESRKSKHKNKAADVLKQLE